MSIQDRLSLQTGYILVSLYEASELQNGIVVPKTRAKVPDAVGEVVIMGPGKTGRNGEPLSDIQVGDSLLFRGGIRIRLDRQSYVLLHEDQALMLRHN